MEGVIVPEIPWFEAVEAVSQHVVKILSPRGSGTGFLLSQGKNRPLCVVATANHVVEHSIYWEEPIRLHHHVSGKSVLLRPEDRSYSLDVEKDTAAILLERKDLPFPETPMDLIQSGAHLKVGNDLGWLGFPAVSPNSLC